MNLDAEVRKTLATTVVTEPAEEFIKAIKLKLQRDIQLAKTLAMIRQQSAQDVVDMIQMVEMSKTSDAILDKHGFDLEHVGKGIEHHKLHDNKEIELFKNLCVAQ